MNTNTTQENEWIIFHSAQPFHNMDIYRWIKYQPSKKEEEFELIKKFNNLKIE